MKKKPYSPLTVKTLTPEQARKVIADRKNCTEEEAAEFLRFASNDNSNRNDQKRNETLNDTKEQEGKRSA